MSHLNATRSRNAMNHQGFYFCSNPTCLCGLHVRMGDPRVRGSGNWAELASGILIGRGIVDGVYLCDGCTREINAGDARLKTVTSPPTEPKGESPVRHLLAIRE